jgi:4-hydroxybenzoate polyprenyltransferase
MSNQEELQTLEIESGVGLLQNIPNWTTQNLYGLLRTMRPKQWVKNGFVFAALLFDGKLQFAQLDDMGRTFIAFLLFCLLSGAVYIMNDLMDIESDRQHPKKRLRPLPAGQLNPAVAQSAAILFSNGTLLVAFSLDVLWHSWLGWVLLAYLLVQIAYTFYIKHIVLLDVSFVALGFILRVAAGVAVISVTRFSPWLYVCTGLLALFLALGKRRHELVLLGEQAGSHRAILKEYNLDLVDRMIGIVTTTALVSYSMYTFLAEGLPENNSMMLTIPFVLYGLFRWLYLIHVRQEGGAPEDVLLKDRPLQINLILWLATVVVVLYL